MTRALLILLFMISSLEPLYAMKEHPLITESTSRDDLFECMEPFSTLSCIHTKDACENPVFLIAIRSADQTSLSSADKEKSSEDGDDLKGFTTWLTGIVPLVAFVHKKEKASVELKNLLTSFEHTYPHSDTFNPKYAFPPNYSKKLYALCMRYTQIDELDTEDKLFFKKWAEILK